MWLTVLAIAFVIGARLIVDHYSNDPRPLAGALTRELWIGPSGPEGTWTVRDHLRGIRFGGGLLLVLGGLGFGLFWLAGLLPRLQTLAFVLQGVGFVALLLGVGAGAGMLWHLLSAALYRWQPQLPPDRDR